MLCLTAIRVENGPMYIVMKLITGIKDSEHFSIVVLWDNDKSELWITI